MSDAWSERSSRYTPRFVRSLSRIWSDSERISFFAGDVGASFRNSSRIRDTARRYGMARASGSLVPDETSDENSSSTLAAMILSRVGE